MIPYNPKKDLETNYYNKTEIELLIASGGGGGGGGTCALAIITPIKIAAINMIFFIALYLIV